MVGKISSKNTCKVVPTPFGNKRIENPIYRVCCVAEMVNLITQKKLKSKNFDFLSFTPHKNFCKNWLKSGSELIVSYDTNKFTNELQPIVYMVPILKDGYLQDDEYILDQINHCLGFIGGLKKNRVFLDIDFEAHIRTMTQQAETCEVVIPEIKYKPRLIKSIQIPLYTDKTIFPNKKAIKLFRNHLDLLLELIDDIPNNNIKIIDPNIIEIP